MKNSQKNLGGFALFEVLFFLLLAGLLIGGAYYVGKNHSKATNKVSTSTSTTTKSQINSIPADWKTYTDNKLGIKLSYLPGWKIMSDPSAMEPAVGGEFGSNHTFYGTLEIELDTKASYFPDLSGLVFGKESTSFSEVTNNAKTTWASTNPFKTPRQTENFSLQGGGQGMMLNQVTSDYSDLDFYLDVGNKFYRFTFREQVLSDGASQKAEDYTSDTDNVIKMVKSIEVL